LGDQAARTKMRDMHSQHFAVREFWKSDKQRGGRPVSDPCLLSENVYALNSVDKDRLMTIAILRSVLFSVLFPQSVAKEDPLAVPGKEFELNSKSRHLHRR
jgi:hypothetical protein